MKKNIDNINLDHYKLVIFDIDGTLYNQKKLRKRMLLSLISYYLFKPHRLFQLNIIRKFRIEREKRKGTVCDQLETEQYQWVSALTSFPVGKIRDVIDEWMFQRPLRYLPPTAFSHVPEIFSRLREKKIRLAVYSDYPTKDKMNALNLSVDLEVASTDPEINALKPAPNGLAYILDHFHIPKERCLFIGDRDSTDGKCAENVDIDYLIIDANGAVYKDLLKLV